jgi:hypothetical protein
MRASLLCWVLTLAVPFTLLSSLLLLPTGVSEAAMRAPVALSHLHRQAEDKAVAGDDDLVEKVRKAITEGVSFLKGQQLDDGSWEINGVPQSGSGGATALVMLALLNAGLDTRDPVIQKGLAWMRKNPAQRTYAAGLQTMVFCLVGDRGDRKRISDNVRWILGARLPDGWSYTRLGLRNAGIADNSNTQYALLGLHEAIVAGIKVDRKVLQEIRDHFIASQKGGGWNYKAGQGGGTMNMTTAGLCNLVITGLDLANPKGALLADGSATDCGKYDENEPVAKALAWLGDTFPARLSDERAAEVFGSPFYGLYGIERAGRLTGQRYLGGHDWYEVGCRWLVTAQRADGSWRGAFGPRALDHYPIVASSFALLFLSKGRTPILISKLAYGDKDYLGWNNKRNDLKNVADFASRELFKNRPMAWQTFDVRTIEARSDASRRKLAAELLQSPIAFFNGHDYAPRGKEEDILKEYVANGGFILAENCCGKARHPDFDRDFQRLMKSLFPDAKLERLEPEHPVWTASGKFTSSARDFPLWGIKQGCKTVVIYSPVPLAGYWEANLFNDRERGQKTFELAANIIAYATGLEAPRPRMSRVEIAVDNPREPVKRGYLQVGQLRHEGDWHPAPRAMRNLMLEARKVGLDVVLKTQALYPSDEGVRDYRFLYMHGRNAFSARKEDLKHLRWNLLSGGLLLADACCGANGFDASFRAFIKELFADDKLKLEPIPVTDELFAAELNGTAIKTVRRRVKSGQRVDPQYQSLPPALEGVKYRGRWVVIYSKVDIGCALEKRTSPDCLGHDPASAALLGRAAVLYALKR